MERGNLVNPSCSESRAPFVCCNIIGYPCPPPPTISYFEITSRVDFTLHMYP